LIKLTKGPKPAVLASNEVAWREEYARYLRGDDVPQAARFRYRHGDIKNALRSECFDKCIYCESKISHTFPGETDHLAPVSKRPDLVVEWQNLAYVCTECNREKLDYYSEAEPLINPYSDLPSDYLIFYGPIVLQRAGNGKGYRTVQKLKLTSRMALIERRKERIEALQALLDLLVRTEPGHTRDLIAEQIRDACAADKEFSAFLTAFVYQSGVFPEAAA
jgi:hypothetical protein